METKITITNIEMPFFNIENGNPNMYMKQNELGIYQTYYYTNVSYKKEFYIDCYDKNGVLIGKHLQNTEYYTKKEHYYNGGNFNFKNIIMIGFNFFLFEYYPSISTKMDIMYFRQVLLGTFKRTFVSVSYNKHNDYIDTTLPLIPVCFGNSMQILQLLSKDELLNFNYIELKNKKDKFINENKHILHDITIKHAEMDFESCILYIASYLGITVDKLKKNNIITTDLLIKAYQKNINLKQKDNYSTLTYNVIERNKNVHCY